MIKIKNLDMFNLLDKKCWYNLFVCIIDDGGKKIKTLKDNYQVIEYMTKCNVLFGSSFEGDSDNYISHYVVSGVAVYIFYITGNDLKIILQ